MSAMCLAKSNHSLMSSPLIVFQNWDCNFKKVIGEKNNECSDECHNITT